MGTRDRLIEIEMLDSLPELKFDQIVEMAADILGSQVSLLSIIDEAEDRQFFKAAIGLPADVAAQRQTPLSHSFCKTVASEAQVLKVSNAKEDPRFRDHPAIESLGVVAYLGAPIVAGEDGPIGALCAIVDSPRDWSDRDERNLATLASAISEIVSHRLTMLRELEAMQNLRDMTERFRDVAESVPGAVFRYTLHPDGTDTVDYMSSGCREIWEVSPEEMQNDASKLWECIVESDAAGMQASVQRSARTFELWQHRWSIIPKSGKKKTLQGYGMPVSRSDGCVAWNSVIIDVTTEVVAQERVHQQDMLLSDYQKQEAIGQIAAGVAHDFNNLLFIIMGSAEMLSEDLTDEDQIATLQAIFDATTRGSELTSSLLAFARQSDLHPEVIDANIAIANLSTLLLRTIPESIELKFSLSQTPCTTKVDSGLLERALLNLVINARDAMPKGGKLTIETAMVELDRNFIAERQENVEPGSYAMLAVTDTGCGISKANLEKVFEPFFSTKMHRGGNGLGLSMVVGFAKQSLGFVRVYSEEGHGTSVKIFMPASSNPAQQSVHTAPLSRTMLDGVRVLVAEDEPAVRRIVVQMLESAKISVVAAASGDSALALFEQDPSAFDLILTDVVMPGTLQGPELVRQIRHQRGAVPVIYMSGYPHEANVHGNGILASDLTLMKPVSRSTLITAISNALRQ